MSTKRATLAELEPQANFVPRHIGPNAAETAEMLKSLGASSLEDFIGKVIPKKIRAAKPLDLPKGMAERTTLSYLRQIASRNEVFTSMIGMGYYVTVTPKVIGALLCYPGSSGEIRDYRSLIDKLHGAGALAVMATDLLALALLTPPGELGADIAVGSSQRFGVPMGYGGPHAAFFATRDEYKRAMPGRII